MPFITSDSYRLYYEWIGNEGLPVLVLSHSLGASRFMWQPQLEAFSRAYRVLLYDHPGHGRSSNRTAAGSMDDFGRDVLTLLDALRVERACFCGLSLGGMVGIWLGAHAPDRIEKLVVSNTAARIADQTLLRARLERLRHGERLEDLAEGVLYKWFTRQFAEAHPDVMKSIREMFLTTTPQAYADTSETLCDMDLRPLLPTIAMPTLVVYGEHDQATPPAWNVAIADAISGSEICALDAAHMSNVEAPQVFTHRVLSFLVQ